MGSFRIDGVLRESGEDQTLTLEAESEADARARASRMGVVVSSIVEQHEADAGEHAFLNLSAIVGADAARRRRANRKYKPLEAAVFRGVFNALLLFWFMLLVLALLLSIPSW
jgi:type II secretory pathway component PulF